MGPSVPCIKDPRMSVNDLMRSGSSWYFNFLSGWKSEWIPRRVLCCSELFPGRMCTRVLEIELFVLDVLIWIHVCQRSQFAISQAWIYLPWIFGAPLHECRE